MLFKGLKEAQGDDSEIKTIYGNLHISFFAEVRPQGQRQLAAKYTCEGEGHADEGWQINKGVVSRVCTDFHHTLFETVVKSERPSARVNGLHPKDQVGTLQLISVNVDCETSADVFMIVER